MNTSTARRVRAILALAILSLGVAVLAFGGIRIVSDPQDFRAFYCGTRAVLERRDPYLAEPIRSCEVREARRAGLTPYEKLALPSPLPGYAFVPLALLASLPFAGASSLFALLSLGALAATFIILGRLTRTPVVAIAAALILSEGLVSLLNGQIVPIVLLALCACAFELRRGRANAASAYAALTAIEPHVAAPVWLCLLVAAPRTRGPLAIWAVVLIAASLGALGFRENLEYLGSVLPAQVRAEACATSQYGLTTLLCRFGIGTELAVTLGNASYLAMCGFGIFVARRLAATYEAPELLVLVPAAFALLGGPYIHLVQMAIAVPALFALAQLAPERRTPLAIATILIALPWQDLVANAAVAMYTFVAVVGAALAFGFWRLRGIAAAGAIAAIVSFGFFERTMSDRAPAHTGDPTAAIAAVAGDDRLTQATWAALIHATQNADPALYLASHLPTWLGLCILVVVAATLPVRKSA